MNPPHLPFSKACLPRTMLGSGPAGRQGEWGDSKGRPERAPSRQSGIGGVKGHNMDDVTMPGSPAVPVPS